MFLIISEIYLFLYRTHVNIRLKEAARLLSEKQHTISEIAMLTGFTDPNNFSTTFKELYGMPPSMYMKEQLSKKEE